MKPQLKITNMKKVKIIGLLSLVVPFLLFTSCTKEDLTPQYISKVVGDYEGYVTYDNGTSVDSFESVCEISKNSDSQISFHCQNSLFATTLIMDVYANGDRLEMCLTGDKFLNMYGHQQGERHMGHMGNSQNSWSHHMDDEHESDDEHFGGIHHENGNLDYTFLIGVQENEYRLFCTKN